MNPFKDRTIEKRMMALVRGIIADAQKAYDDAILQAETALEEKIESLKKDHETSKLTLADDMVKEALSKLK